MDGINATCAAVRGACCAVLCCAVLCCAVLCTCHVQWSVLGQLLDDLLHHVAVLTADITGVQLHMVVAAGSSHTQEDNVRSIHHQEL